MAMGSWTSYLKPYVKMRPHVMSSHYQVQKWFLVFSCMAILIAQLPNLNSMAKVSLIGATTAIGYCTLILVLSITKGRPIGISYDQSEAMKSNMKKFSDMLNALAIIALAFREHNVMLSSRYRLVSLTSFTFLKFREQ